MVTTLGPYLQYSLGRGVAYKGVWVGCSTLSPFAHSQLTYFQAHIATNSNFSRFESSWDSNPKSSDYYLVRYSNY